MKVLFAVHGYPPELVGGTESAVQALARGLARSGVEVVVVAGSLAVAGEGRSVELSRDGDADTGDGPPIRIVRLHRGDLHFDHWHKGSSPAVGRAFSALLEEERPDLVHVHHWIRLTGDLVARGARAGRPARAPSSPCTTCGPRA